MTHISLMLFLATCAVANGAHRLCYSDYPELDGLLCYKKCKSGYYGVGPVCWGHCPPHTTNIGALCVKQTRTRGVGKTLRFCRSGQEKSGLLCYPKCKSGYGGAGPVCWRYCDSGYHDDGMFCRKDVHATNRDVGNCPWYDACGLCGGPWYNVCGNRRNCGGSCPSGYRNDGCTCWRDAHIYAKDSYGRGSGESMVCGSNEDQNVALCYPKCRGGFYGVGPVCWASCTGKTIDTGTQCQKKSYGRGVGKVLNCFTSPTSLQNAKGLLSTFLTFGKVNSFQSSTCLALYYHVKPWLTMLDTFNGCYKNTAWGTLSLSIAIEASMGVSGTDEIGIAIDVDRKKGICYIGHCMGFKLDLSVGAELIVGWWKNLGVIPGKSSVISVGADMPLTEVGAGVSWVKSDKGEYIGTTYGVGIGVGANPIDFGAYDCDTPEKDVIHFSP